MDLKDFRMLKHFITCLTALFIITGCKKNKQEEAVLVIATSADQPPFEFFNPKQNRVEGFDIDLATEIANRLNKKAEIRDMDFGGILPSIQSGQVDLAIAGITRTKEREKTVDFTIDYYKPQMAIVYKKSDPVLNTTEFPHKRVGAQIGSYHQFLLEDVLEKTSTSFEIVARGRLLDLIQELLSNNLNAVIMDYAPAEKFLASHPDVLEITAFEHPAAQAYAIALPKDSDLKEKINLILKQLIQEGFITQLEKKWLQKAEEK